MNLCISIGMLCIFFSSCAFAADNSWRKAYAHIFESFLYLDKSSSALERAIFTPKARAKKVNLMYPSKLDQDDTEYILINDIEADGTAFTIAASKVTLNLNGYTINFGNKINEKSHGVLIEGYNRKDLQILGGRIEQGMASAAIADSSPIMCPNHVFDISVLGMTVRWNSPQTAGISIPWGKGAVSGNILIDDGNEVKNRHQQVAAINAMRAADTSVEGNAIIRARQSGVAIGEKNTKCLNNVIFVDSQVTNSYGVFYYGDKKLAGKSWICEGNTIMGVGVHPIGIGVVSEASGGIVAGNVVDVQCTKTSAEYGKPIGSAGYRTTWGANDVLVKNNVFIVRGTKGSINGHDSRGRAVWAAVNKGDSLRFENNIIKALGDHPSVKVAGIAVTGNNESSGLVFEGNDVESTWATVLLADAYGHATNYPVFVNNTFRLSGSNPEFMWMRDDYKDWASTGLFVDNSVQGVSETAFALNWDSKETKEILFGKKLEFVTHDSLGRPLPNRPVDIRDQAGWILASGRTGVDGKASIYVPLRSVSNRDITGQPIRKRQDRDIEVLEAVSSVDGFTLSLYFDPRKAGPVVLSQVTTTH